MNFSNSYSLLGDKFYQRISPTAVAAPQLLLWNNSLAEQLQLSEQLQNDELLKAQIFSGNQLPSGADSMALAYSGHQFGQLNPQLGDGRAHLLGELIDNNKQRVDVQLKGSGPTAYSRRGDGRCALGPALREYIMSEAMYALRIPTSRCLAVVATGEQVYRETAKPGAVVTRVAASHIRVGTFQYFAIRGDIESLTALRDYTINRHFPAIDVSAQNHASDTKAPKSNTIQLLEAAIDKQITLVVEWMRIGFIHGVMNTDNTAISGETIDYGPCSMMGSFDPKTVYSSIDREGRYCFGNQASIALWNMTRFAECLLPLINSDNQQAVAEAEYTLSTFGDKFEQSYYQMLGHKLGLVNITPDGQEFFEQLLALMQKSQLDYTLTFSQLTDSLTNDAIADDLSDRLGDWYTNWRKRLANAEQDIDSAKQLMANNNPVVIPRNHHMEAVLTSCEEQGNAQAAEDFLAVLRSPYRQLAATADYQSLAEDGDRHYQTFCGT